jgi:two-component system, NtrC family, response regulator GlrR
MKSRRILLIDDDPGLLRLVSLRLEAAGYTVDTATDGNEGLARIANKRPHLVITDLRMDGMDGLTLFRELHRDNPSIPVIILTAHGSIPEAVQATRDGAFAFLTKPFDGKQLLTQIERALAISPSANGADADDGAWREGILTCSRAMEELLAQAKLVATTDTSVMIRGESGTGKELLARAIHRASARAEGPFVTVNCAAIPEALLESELFGHVRGAFTGATRDHTGLFQQAHEGTLFLDEIGDMPLGLQAKVLRVVQDGDVRPVGSTRTLSVNARLVCATHRNLEEAVHSGEFREDLYYRLNVVELVLPPLSERREDVPLIARHLLDELARRNRRAAASFAPEAMELLVQSEWPGNIRQLRNVIEHAFVLSASSLVSAGHLRRVLREQPQAFPALDQARDHFERDYLVRLLKVTGGNVSQAARLASRNRTDFYRLLQKHGIEPSGFKPAP